MGKPTKENWTSILGCRQPSPRKVEQIPNTFPSMSCYMNSFTFPLIEETRADLCSSINKVSTAPTYEILEIKDAEPPTNMFYAIKVGKNKDIETDVEKYEPQKEDLIALTNVRPKCIDDLNRPMRSYVVGLVQKVINERDYITLHIISSKLIELEQYMHKNMNNGVFFAVFLTNMTTNIRIWKALNFHLDGRNMSIIKKVLQHDSAVGGRCGICLKEGNYRIAVSNLGPISRSFNLNMSQAEAVSNGFATRNCYHENTVKLIWGPPGTGKTKTVAVLLYALLGQKCRTVTCAPTNIAVLEVAARLLRLVTESIGYETYGLGDIVLFGNRKRMKIDDHSDLLNIFLDYRAKILAKCFAPASGWKHCLASLICLLENPEEQYRLYLRNEKDEEGDEEVDDDDEEVEDGRVLGRRSLKYTQDKLIWREVIAQTLRSNLKKINWNCKAPTQQEKQSKFGRENWGDHSQLQKKLNFEDFFRGRYNSKRKFMKLCVVNLVSHLPTSYISQGEVKNMIRTLNLLEYLKTLLYSDAINGIGLKEVLVQVKNEGQGVKGFTMLNRTREECLQLLKSLREGFFIPNFFDESSIKMFCLQNACLFFLYCLKLC